MWPSYTLTLRAHCEKWQQWFWVMSKKYFCYRFCKTFWWSRAGLITGCCANRFRIRLPWVSWRTVSQVNVLPAVWPECHPKAFKSRLREDVRKEDTACYVWKKNMKPRPKADSIYTERTHPSSHSSVIGVKSQKRPQTLKTGGQRRWRACTCRCLYTTGSVWIHIP